MKRSAALLVPALVLLLLVPASAAHAAQTSVSGTNSYTRLVLVNGQTQVTLRMYGPGGGPCSVKYVDATVRDADGTRYTLSVGCYPGNTWAVGLSRGNTLVKCPGAKLSYVGTGGFWRGVMPRSCLSGLANRIKVTRSSLVDWSPTPGEAGPTRYVARG